MRKNRWIAPVWGMLAAAALGHTATAQSPASPLEGNFPPVGPGPVAPGPMTYPGHPTYTPVAPDAASPAGFPPAMEPWPTISPYEHGFDQTYNDDGIWFRQMLNKERKYQVNVEFISGKFRQPGHAAIGADSVIGDVHTDRFGEAQGGINPFSIYTVKDAMSFSDKGRYLSDDSEIEYPSPPGGQVGPPVRPVNFSLKIVGLKSGDDNGDSTGTTDLTFPMNKVGLLQVVNWDGGTPNESIDFESEIAKTVLYPVSGQVLGEDAVTRFGGDPDIVMERHRNPSSPGLRFSIGLEDEDQSGANWGAYYLSGQPTVFRRGTDDPNRPMITNIVFFEAPHLGSGLSEEGISNAGPDRLTPAFEVLDYNTLFEVTNETEVGGTDLAFYHTPFLDLGWMRMRPMWGARYDYISESFGFTGRDNGYAYAYAVDGSAFTSGGDDDDGGGSTGLGLYEPVLGDNRIPLTGLPTDPVIYPYETTVKSRVQSHLYGPQVGFDWQAGGENLMLFASTKTGAILNTEKLSLDTTGFGSTEALTGIRPSKSDSKTHTRFVPFLEFSANADVNVFPIIPVVNRWDFLKNARIRGGWTALVVGNVQRPIDQIVWRSDDSGGAYIKERGRDAWYTQYWNVGVHWNF